MSHVRVQLPADGISLKAVERQAVIEALNMAGWAKPAAARLLRMSTEQLDYKIAIHSLKLPDDIELRVTVHGQPLGSARLNEESTSFAWLFQHADTPTRLRLFDAIRQNDCTCIRCIGTLNFGPAPARLNLVL